jgi:hypothetical protein
MLAAICPLQLYHQCFGGRPCGGLVARSDASASTLRMPSSTRSSSLQATTQTWLLMKSAQGNQHGQKGSCLSAAAFIRTAVWALLCCIAALCLTSRPNYL